MGEENEEKEEERPILEIREQANEIEKRVLAFCMDSNKKVNKEQTTTIVRHFKDMRSLLGEGGAGSFCFRTALSRES